MTGRELFTQLEAEGLADLPLVGYSGDETVCILASYAKKTSDTWHDSLPAGRDYVDLSFETVIPHERGEGEFKERVPPPRTKYHLVCRYCNSATVSYSHEHCKRCSWSPMMEAYKEEEVWP